MRERESNREREGNLMPLLYEWKEMSKRENRKGNLRGKELRAREASNMVGSWSPRCLMAK